MNMLQSSAVTAATAFLVLAFCTGIKTACRKKLRQDKNDKAIPFTFYAYPMTVLTKQSIAHLFPCRMRRRKLKTA